MQGSHHVAQKSRRTTSLPRWSLRRNVLPSTSRAAKSVAVGAAHQGAGYEGGLAFTHARSVWIPPGTSTEPLSDERISIERASMSRLKGIEARLKSCPRVAPSGSRSSVNVVL